MEAASALHSAAPAAKIVGVTVFVLIVVATPRQWVPAFLGYLLVVISALVLARVPWRRALAGLVIEVPFVAFALLLPLISGSEGMWAAWNILAKATLGVLAATLLAATTLPVDLVAGLQALRLPGAIVAIFSFFIRYVDVVADEFSRMRTAQQARGMRATSPRSWSALASGLGALFVRSYERGERVHLALVSRGYDGRLPAADVPDGPAWPAALLPIAAAVVFGMVGVWQW